MKSISFFILSLVFLSSTHADILVLNLNGNNSTVKAAKKAAKLRGEKVIELPKPGEFVDKEYLQLFLNDNKNLDLSSIVLSGHDGAGFFSGGTGSLNKLDIKEVMEENPEIAKNVKSLVLRGCYTATFNEAIPHTVLKDNNHWQSIFPNLNMVAGYVGGAPSSEKIESTSFIEEILTLENALYNAESVDKLQDLFSNISNSKYTTHAIAMRMCHNPDKLIYGNLNLIRRGIKFDTTENIKKLCNMSLLEKNKKILEKYYYANHDGVRNPPKNHHSSDLRSAYAFLHENMHCLSLSAEERDTVDLQKAIRLIYFDYILNNFEIHNSSFLEELESVLKWYSDETSDLVELPDLKNLTRSQILDFIHKLYEISRVDYETTNATPTFALKNLDNPNIIFLQRAASYFNDMLFKLEPESVPFDWVSSKNSQVKQPMSFYSYADDINTSIRNPEAAIYEGLDVESKLEVFLSKDASNFDNLEDLITEDLMFNIFQEVPTSFSNMTDQLIEALDINPYNLLPRLINVSSSPENTISLHKRVKEFISKTKEKYPYESIFIAMKFRMFFNESELKELFKGMLNSEEFKKKNTEEVILDYVNSNVIMNHRAGHKIPQTFLRDLFENNIPQIKPTLKKMRESIISSHVNEYPDYNIEQSEIDSLP